MYFNCLAPSIVFQEVPGEIALCFSITGCKVGCKGCHSTEIWNEKSGTPLTNTSFTSWIDKYQGLISCVLFFGGEWQTVQLIEKLKIAKHYGLKTCLYSGEKYVDMAISDHLDFLKTGRWVAELGGLDSPYTNQVFRDMNSSQKLNHLFVPSSPNGSNAPTNLFSLTQQRQGADNVAA
ncbi:anaerobic ribonucleoside-triphosphate reductase activating protein [Shewanella sp. UCD-KL12]|uniref:anaerobic ribonucleoside-triphosphate reductase activating protein n=1 Tax=Shewanella sp. UCD-KL12 TaxID=1917163 RepID=UPI0009F8A056|nr:anaerobic ribonucleoside-triphosphate reductase activating protein [Shewanella sp. UCD-KL12]